MIRVDCHQHFWRLSRGDYGWLDAAQFPRIARDFLPNDLAPLLAAGRIDRTILVQAAPTEAETRFLLDIAHETPFVAGVVGWMDFEAPDAAERISTLSTDKRLVGLRPMIQDIADTEWMLRGELAPALDAMKRNHLRFDALVKPPHLPALAAFIERHDGLAMVIDHGAKPDIQGQGLAGWETFMRRIGRNTQVTCKLSGLAFEAGPRWTAEILKPFVEVLLESFGPSRLMWGSDWPVLNEVGDYQRWLEACEALTSNLNAAEREQIFGGTAAAFYGIAE